MVSVATFAQKVMGKVVDENGNALQHVSLQVVGKEDLYILDSIVLEFYN